jgi:hypothetical protein
MAGHRLYAIKAALHKVVPTALLQIFIFDLGLLATWQDHPKMGEET